MTETRPSILACSIISATMHIGSNNDGKGDDWDKHGSLYHLVKGMSHLASHIKYKIDDRKKPSENHLHKAITRLAMAASIEVNRK